MTRFNLEAIHYDLLAGLDAKEPRTFVDAIPAKHKSTWDAETKAHLELIDLALWGYITGAGDANAEPPLYTLSNKGVAALEWRHIDSRLSI